MSVIFKDNPSIALTDYELLEKRIDKGVKALRKLDAIGNLYWTSETVKKYFTDNPIRKGDELLVHDTAGLLGKNKYTLVTVREACRGWQEIIVVSPFVSYEEHGQSFDRSGRNCWAPTGQVTLKPYHSIIGQMIKEGNGKYIVLTCREVESIIGPDFD